MVVVNPAVLRTGRGGGVPVVDAGRHDHLAAAFIEAGSDTATTVRDRPCRTEAVPAAIGGEGSPVARVHAEFGLEAPEGSLLVRLLPNGRERPRPVGRNRDARRVFRTRATSRSWDVAEKHECAKAAEYSGRQLFAEHGEFFPFES